MKKGINGGIFILIAVLYLVNGMMTTLFSFGPSTLIEYIPRMLGCLVIAACLNRKKRNYDLMAGIFILGMLNILSRWNIRIYVPLHFFIISIVKILPWVLFILFVKNSKLAKKLWVLPSVFQACSIAISFILIFYFYANAQNLDLEEFNDVYTYIMTFVSFGFMTNLQAVFITAVGFIDLTISILFAFECAIDIILLAAVYLLSKKLSDTEYAFDSHFSTVPMLAIALVSIMINGNAEDRYGNALFVIAAVEFAALIYCAYKLLASGKNVSNRGTAAKNLLAAVLCFLALGFVMAHSGSHMETESKLSDITHEYNKDGTIKYKEDGSYDLKYHYEFYDVKVNGTNFATFLAGAIFAVGSGYCMNKELTQINSKPGKKKNKQ